MTDTIVSITSPWFWGIAACAIMGMRLFSGWPQRRYLFAGVNLLFLAMLLGIDVLVVIGCLALAWSLLKLIARPGTRLGSIIVTGALLLGTFIFHKTAHGNTLVASPWTSSILVAIGFSYVALRMFDVARAVWEASLPPPSPVDLVNYLVPFHMLAAGPIQAYHDFARQPATCGAIDQRTVVMALDRIARGVFKKLVLAFAVQKLFLTNFTAGAEYGVIEAQMTLIWLYLDFSAYSDIAMGLGLAMGVATPENFDKPFRSRNLMEFWDRWHISLSLFIRRNLFFPIQIALVRRSDRPHPLLFAAIATMISFTLAGLWHGIGYGWLIWGLLHAVGLVIVRLWGFLLQKRLSQDMLERYRTSYVMQIVATILTFEYVAFAFVPVFILSGKS